MENISQTKPLAEADEKENESWIVVLQMPTKAIRFSLSQEECRERRTISWLNNPPKKQLVDNYVPVYPGFREIRDAEIIIAKKQILHYKNFHLDLKGVIFAHDEYQKMGTSQHSNNPDHHRLTPDGVDIITKSSGTPAFHINCHIYNLHACLAKYDFIPMTNVLIKRLDGAPGSAKDKGTKFFPFLALNKDYIDGFSILFRGSRLKNK